MVGIHSIEYDRLASYFYLFGVYPLSKRAKRRGEGEERGWRGGDRGGDGEEGGKKDEKKYIKGEACRCIDFIQISRRDWLVLMGTGRSDGQNVEYPTPRSFFSSSFYIYILLLFIYNYLLFYLIR